MQTVLSKLPTEDAIYAVESRTSEENQLRDKKIILAIAVLLLCALTVSISLGIKQRRQAEWEAQFGKLLEEVGYKLSEGKNLAELNPTRARELVQESSGLIAQLQQRGLAPDQLTSLQSQIGEVLGLASGRRDVNAKSWLSLGLVRANMQAEDLRAFQNQLVILDRTEDRVVKVGLNDKSATVVAGKDQIGDAQQSAIYGDKIYTLSSKGIIEITNTAAAVVITPDPEWGNVTDMELFANNIYLLSSTGIWKYPVIETGFGAKQAWLSADTPPVPNATAITLDGYIWAAEGNRIHKFVQNRADAFTIAGMSEPFTSITSLYTDEDTNFLYVLEASKQRIVTIEKNTGIYKQQYTSPELTSATNLIVRESDGTIIVLARDKLLEIPL